MVFPSGADWSAGTSLSCGCSVGIVKKGKDAKKIPCVSFIVNCVEFLFFGRVSCPTPSQKSGKPSHPTLPSISIRLRSSLRLELRRDFPLDIFIEKIMQDAAAKLTLSGAEGETKPGISLPN